MKFQKDKPTQNIMTAGLPAFIKLGKRIQKLLLGDEDERNLKKFHSTINKAGKQNPWFTENNAIKAFEGIAMMIEEDVLKNFISKYNHKIQAVINPKHSGVIMPGNIPMAGFHDMMCVLLSGNSMVAKFSNDDNVLMKYLVDELIEIEPGLKDMIHIEERLKNFDAVIATGSSNSSRYFEYYFGKYPHIIRKNRNGAAILDGTESPGELILLGGDIFTYFGLGCRSVSKLYVPLGYNFNVFFESINVFAGEMINHNKYTNNFEYHHALFLLQKIPFLTNNFLIIKEGEALTTPVAVVNYEFYNNIEQLNEKLNSESEKIQCIVSNQKLTGEISERSFYFGQSQKPAITDYADGTDTMEFLLSLSN